MLNKLSLFPQATTVDAAGHLLLAGHRAGDLAGQFGTPLYVYDVETIRANIRRYRQSLADYPASSRLTYASKAFLCPALARLMTAEGVGLDVASAGEIFIARRGGADPAHMHMHGNNKSRLDLNAALQAGVGRIVVDNAAELQLLANLAAEQQRQVNLWLRVTPDVTVETHHRYTVTGIADSKFGFPLNEAEAVAGKLITKQQGRRGAGGRRRLSLAPHRPAPPPRLSFPRC
jgi:diaminopimelate decarboxylase